MIVTHFLGHGLCSGSNTLERVPETCLLDGEGYDTLNGCLGEGFPPSCLQASKRDRNGRRVWEELERSAFRLISYGGGQYIYWALSSKGWLAS